MSNHFYIWSVVMVRCDGNKFIVKTGLTRFKAVQAKVMLNEAAALEKFPAAFIIERRAAA